MLFLEKTASIMPGWEPWAKLLNANANSSGGPRYSVYSVVFVHMRIND